MDNGLTSEDLQLFKEFIGKEIYLKTISHQFYGKVILISVGKKFIKVDYCGSKTLININDISYFSETK